MHNRRQRTITVRSIAVHQIEQQLRMLLVQAFTFGIGYDSSDKGPPRRVYSPNTTVDVCDQVAGRPELEASMRFDMLRRVVPRVLGQTRSLTARSITRRIPVLRGEGAA